MRLPTRVAGRLSRGAVLACGLLFASAGVASAQEPVKTLLAVARQKVRQQDLTKSAQLGFGVTRKAFSDLPAQGGILIGFDVQLSKFLDYEVVHAIQPLYVTDIGDIAGTEFGDFSDKPGKKKNANLTRNLRVKAPRGYAVGAITIRSGLFIDGMKLTYHRINPQGLDPELAVASIWIGNETHGSATKTIGNNGMPIVGIFGNQDDRRVLALGIYQVSVPVTAAPKVAQPPADAVEPVVVPREVPEVKPAAEAPADVEVAVEKAEPKPAVKEASGQSSSWLLAGIVALLGLAAFFGWLVIGGKRAEPVKSSGRRPAVAKKQPRTTPPPLPAEPQDFPMVIDAEAITAKPPMIEPASRALDIAVPELPSIVREQPPYFHARAVFALKPNRFYRVYVLPETLLFLDAGPENNDRFAHGAAAAGAMTGGLVGAVIGQAIGAMIDHTRKDSLQDRKNALDRADMDELMRMSAEGSPNFRVALDDLADARIEPTNVWHSMQYLGHQYIGLFRFRHPDHGDLTLEIPDVNSMKIALEELPQTFGDGLDVQVAFDRQSWKYVAKG